MLEALYPYLVALVLGFSGILFERVFRTLEFRKKAPLISKVYDVIDPILDEYHPDWSGSNLDTILELAFNSVTDGGMDDKEIRKTVELAKSVFSPELVSTKKLVLGTQEGLKTQEILGFLTQLEKGEDRLILIEKAKSTPPLLIN
jgi:hypothetical protein